MSSAKETEILKMWRPSVADLVPSNMFEGQIKMQPKNGGAKAVFKSQWMAPSAKPAQLPVQLLHPLPRRSRRPHRAGVRVPAEQKRGVSAG